MNGIGEVEFLQLELVNKSIYQPYRIAGSHLLLKRAEVGLATICAGNKLYGVNTLLTAFCGLCTAVYIWWRGGFFHRLTLAEIIKKQFVSK